MSKLVIFCNHFNIEDRRKYATFWCIMLYYFKKGKNATQMQKKRFVQCMEVMTNQMCQKCFMKFLGTLDILAK